MFAELVFCAGVRQIRQLNFEMSLGEITSIFQLTYVALQRKCLRRKKSLKRVLNCFPPQVNTDSDVCVWSISCFCSFFLAGSAYRECMDNGTWALKINYSNCEPILEEKVSGVIRGSI